MSTASLLDAIDEFVREKAMAETTFGRLAVNDGKFVGRLKRGGRVWPETADRVLSFIDGNRQAGKSANDHAQAAA